MQVSELASHVSIRADIKYSFFFDDIFYYNSLKMSAAEIYHSAIMAEGRQAEMFVELLSVRLK